MEPTQEQETAIVPASKKELQLSKGVIPQDFDDLIRFASLVHKANLAPKGFDTLEKVAVGILTNLEMGRPIIVGLQDLAIINGRCGIYGDATLAQVTASGLMDEGYPIEEESGTPFQDNWTFKCTVKRKGRRAQTGVWTWAESKRAGFDEPKTKDGRKDIWSPWTRFTRRMMQWKARAFVLRDNFGDVLKGLKTVEELHDYEPLELQRGTDGTYSTGNLTDKLKANAKPKPDTSTFDRLVEEKIGQVGLHNTDQYRALTVYIDVSAEKTGKAVDEIKALFANDFEDSWKHFEDWANPKKPAAPADKNNQPGEEPAGKKEGNPEDGSAGSAGAATLKWDPYKADLMSRYMGEKPTILIEECRKRGIEYMGRTARQMHIALLENNAAGEAGGPELNDQKQAATQGPPDEQFAKDKALRATYIEDLRRIGDIDRGIWLRSKTTSGLLSSQPNVETMPIADLGKWASLARQLLEEKISKEEIKM